jgi:hypothetical protein
MMTSSGKVLSILVCVSNSFIREKEMDLALLEKYSVRVSLALSKQPRSLVILQSVYSSCEY